MTARRVAAALGLLGVALGAFGAHALRDRMSDAQTDWWRTAVLYHLVHAVAALATGGAGGRATAATWSFAAGVVLFSGSLYAMAVGAPTVLGAVTPLGGLAFLAGWALLWLRPAPPPTP